MWPWEHLAVGYLAYSLLARRWGGAPPTGAAVAAVALGTQFPDLVDKPLAWSFEAVPSGVSVAHSVFVALGLSAVVVVAARRVDRPALGVAFAVGYLTHLPADALYPVILGGEVTLSAFFWPLVEAEPPLQSGFVANLVYYLFRFLAFLASPRGLVFLLLEATLVVLAVRRWVKDGRPGLRHPPSAQSVLRDD